MPLVNSPEATGFMELMSTDTGRKALLGDKGKVNGSALNHISFAQQAMADGVAKIPALANDPTRTEVQRHHAARQVANKVGATLIQSQAGLESVARELADEGNQMIAEKFALDPNGGARHADMRHWIREQADKPDGIMKIREMANVDSELIAVMQDSRFYLLGLSEDTRAKIVLDGFKRFAPEGWLRLQQSKELKELAGRYPAAIQKVHLFFYNPTLADQANRRVEV